MEGSLQIYAAPRQLVGLDKPYNFVNQMRAMR